MYVIRSIWDISVLYKHFRLKLISHFLYYVILEILFSLVYIKSKLLNIHKQHCQTFFVFFGRPKVLMKNREHLQIEQKYVYIFNTLLYRAAASGINFYCLFAHIFAGHFHIILYLWKFLCQC